MFNKLSTKSLIITFGVLLAAVIIFIVIDSNHGESTFKQNLVTIDTAQVTSISIYPQVNKHQEVRLFKKDNSWQVKLDNNITALVPQNKITNMFRQLLSIKPMSVAAQSKNKWAEYKVDSNATQVKVFEGNNNTLNLYLGKFSYQQPRTMISYVRVGNDDNVYAVNGFLNVSFNQKANFFRDNEVINNSYTNWDTLVYNYPDSSFQLIKVNKEWFVNGRHADSASTVNYLRALSHLRSTQYADNFDQTLLVKPAYSLKIKSSDNKNITVNAYRDQNNYIINSSINPESYFDATKEGLGAKIFVGKSKLLNPPPKKKK